MAKEAYYFSHDANSRNDPKILSMMLDYGIEGYGMFWIIVENLREQDGYKLKQDKSTWRAFAMQMHKTVEEVKVFINDCVLEYELFVIDDVYFYSESLLRRMYKKDKIIQKRKDAANTRWSKDKNTDVMQVHSKSNANVMQLDAKETKLNETKLNETKKKNKRFKTPTLTEVQEYCNEKQNNIDPEKFINYYDSVGWVIGKDKPMKSWKGAIGNWASRENKKSISIKSNDTYIRSAAKPNDTLGER